MLYEMKSIKILVFIGVIGFALMSFTAFQDGWNIPAKYKSMTNPEEASKDNIAMGKSLYAKHCKSCHGKDGLGDGPKAEEVDGDLGDFSTAEFQAQGDGILFYKSYIGKDDMPNYEKKMSEEDAWLVVHYLRTLKE